MQRYLVEAMPLGKAAVGDALAAAGLAPTDVGLFAVCSCTGYVTPGLDILLARDLGMAPDTQRLFIGHMGCYAALPGLGVVRDFVPAYRPPGAAALLRADQPARATAERRCGADRLARAVRRRCGRGRGQPAGRPGTLSIREIASVTDVATADHMTWDVTDLGFRMGLSRAGTGRARAARRAAGRRCCSPRTG